MVGGLPAPTITKEAVWARVPSVGVLLRPSITKVAIDGVASIGPGAGATCEPVSVMAPYWGLPATPENVIRPRLP